MKYEIRTEGPYTIIALSGDVDLQHSPKAREQILGHLNKRCNILVDLSKVEYIDSSGIASLVEGYQQARSNNLNFALIGVSETALQVLKLARLDKVFLIYDSIDDIPEKETTP